MKKPRFKKNHDKRAQKKGRYELKRKEARKRARLQYLETTKFLNSLPEEEAAKLLGEEEESEFDDEN